MRKVIWYQRFFRIIFGICGFCGFFETTAIAIDLQFFSQAPISSSALRLYAEFDYYETTPNQLVTLIIHGFLEPGWHVYSIHSQGEDGPVPTTLNFGPSPLYQTAGALTESPPLFETDRALGISLSLHKQEFVLKQPFRINSNAPEGDFDLHGSLSYQVCDNNVCAPLQHVLFTVPFHVRKSGKSQ